MLTQVDYKSDVNGAKVKVRAVRRFVFRASLFSSFGFDSAFNGPEACPCRPTARQISSYIRSRIYVRSDETRLKNKLTAILSLKIAPRLVRRRKRKSGRLSFQICSLFSVTLTRERVVFPRMTERDSQQPERKDIRPTRITHVTIRREMPVKA